jgi:hypothetical protein
MTTGRDIAEFLRQEQNKAARFTLGREAHGRMVTIARVDGANGEPLDVEAEAKRLFANASRFADMDPGQEERFIVASWDADNLVREQMPFHLGGEELALAMFARPDSPNSTGAVKATMRHLEHREAGLRKMQAELSASLRQELRAKSKRIAELEAQNDQLRSKHAEFLEVLEQSKTQAHARRLAQIDAESDMEAKAWFFKQLQQFAPIIAAKLTGSDEVAKFVKTLDEQKLAAILSALTEEQRASFEGFLLRAAKSDRAQMLLAQPPPDKGAET